MTVTKDGGVPEALALNEEAAAECVPLRQLERGRFFSVCTLEVH